jgi:hypothetical protein
MIIISVHRLFSKEPRPLVSVSTADISILHSAEVVHLYPQVVIPICHHLYQGSGVGYTTSFSKVLSNKCSPLRIPHQPVRSLPQGVTNIALLSHVAKNIF